jgi:hypothetical protein
MEGTMTTTNTNGDALGFAAPETSRPIRRALVGAALAGYPVFVAAWVGLPALGVTGIPWAIVVGALGLGVILAATSLYQFRRRMAQSPDRDLDERQIAIRDRAYLVSYRVFCAIVLVGLLVVGILPDVLDRPLALTFETVQPLFWGAFLYSIILPSAAVAWQEPDLPAEA